MIGEACNTPTADATFCHLREAPPFL